jgi:hypothetical protein
MYAMGRRLSLANGVPLFMEIQSGFARDFYRRTFGLDVFNISCQQTAKAPQSKLTQFATIVTNRMLPFTLRRYHSDLTGGGGFDPRYLDLKLTRPVFLDGYWHDERYFSDIRSELKSDLRFVQPHAEATESLAREMRAPGSVAVHVRRLHGVPAGSEQPMASGVNLPSEYYKAAIQNLKERVRNPRFYIFSDSSSLESVPGFEGEDFTRVQIGGIDAPHEDLYLMSQCQHFVMANSTFSWWGAWLGNTSSSVVVSPALREWGMTLRLPEDWHSIEWSKRP